ncbi:MAG: YggS family pyridoxal phosphate-dependent enzyme [Candidatus Omnitrophota bacterium]
MVKDSINKIKERISSVCSGLNQDPGRIVIVAVTKGRTPAEVKEAIEAGLTDIGENRVQEAAVKYNAIQAKGTGNPPAINWHMVGHLQTNKVKEAVGIFGLIQSVDSLRLAREIDKEAAKINKVQDILIEIKTSPEATKSGINPDEALKAVEEIAGFKNIYIKGLMTIAPVTDDPAAARPYFKVLRELKDKINGSRIIDHELQVLSMGMTDDFEAAIEEGSNMVRLGRAIFE